VRAVSGKWLAGFIKHDKALPAVEISHAERACSVLIGTFRKMKTCRKLQTIRGHLLSYAKKLTEIAQTY
jgi:hypothetical protein